MDRHKPPRNPTHLILGISGFMLLAAYVNLLTPDSWWLIAIFIAAFSLSSGLVIHFLFRNMKQTAILSVGIALFLALRVLGLKNLLYTVLLVASVISVEFVSKKR